MDEQGIGSESAAAVRRLDERDWLALIQIETVFLDLHVGSPIDALFSLVRVVRKTPCMLRVLMRLVSLALLLMLACLSGASADAGPALRWDAPDSCPDVEAVRARVAEWLAPGQSAAGVKVSAEVREREGEYLLALKFKSSTGSGSETLVATQCETLMDVVALKAALAAGPGAVQVARPREPSRARGYARAAAGGALGVLPSFAPAVAMALGLRWRRMAVEVGGTYDLPRDHRYAQLRDVGGRFSLGSVEGRVCLLADLAPVELPLCLGALVGALRAAGEGTADVKVSRQLWAALPLTAAIRWPRAGRWALWAEASALLSLLRPEFYVRNLSPLHRPDRTGARAAIGIEVRFP